MEAAYKIVRTLGGGAGGRFLGPVARRDGRVARAPLPISDFGLNPKIGKGKAGHRPVILPNPSINPSIHQSINPSIQ